MSHISDAEHEICDAEGFAPSLPEHGTEDLNAFMFSYGRTQTGADSATLASFADDDGRTVL